MTPALHHHRFRWWHLLPLYGSLAFLVLYVIAALYYPGGNYLNKTYPGFSWAQNYWCNLLSETAINGQPNPARPIAFAAMGLLCISLISFFHFFPAWAGFNRQARYAIRVSGAISLILCLFLFTRLHDVIINVAGLFGLIAITGTLVGLKRMRRNRMFALGLVVLMLIGLNNVLYHNHHLIYYLPVIQKISFLLFLLWISLINLAFRRPSPHP